jgi:hypothetical protein
MGYVSSGRTIKNDDLEGYERVTLAHFKVHSQHHIVDTDLRTSAHRNENGNLDLRYM